MSEFMEKHSVARLIGAPPGYVGYEEGGYLTEPVRRKPYSVILLDEIEKAHPDVFNVLLQVLDDGRMTDGQGRTVDFRNTVIVMTSNLGSHKIQQMTDEGDGPCADQDRGDGGSEDAFPSGVRQPDRRDRRVPSAREGADREHRAASSCTALEAAAARSSRSGSTSRDAALQDVAQAGFDPVYGARPLKRAIQQQIENPLAKEILSGKYAARRHGQW